MNDKSELKNFSPYYLPSDFKSMEVFIQKNKIEIMERVLSSIEYSLKNNLSLIEVFQFENTNYVVTLTDKEFLENIEHIFQYYIKNEKYELCTRLKKIESLFLKNKNVKSKKEKNSKKQ